MASPENLHGIPTDKTRLQEYTQRACVQLPVYQTLNEGPPHALQFKSQVLVDGIWYTSPDAFSSRKIAEHDAAKHAFIGFQEKLKAEGRSLILEDIYFCKAIINEYAAKMNMPTPTYVTNKLKACVQIFMSSLQLNGVSFTGDAARTKKEAEQFAARAAILSILVSDTGTTMSGILKSKFKFYNALKLAKASPSIQASPVMGSPCIQASPVMGSPCIQASPVMGSPCIQASPVMGSPCIQASPVMGSSSIPASAIKVSSNIPACIAKDSSSTPTCSVKDSSITPASTVKDSSSTLTCIINDPSSIPACVAKNPASMQACFVKDSPNIRLGPVATEVAPMDSALVSFTSTKEVDIGLCAIKDTLATIQMPNFAPFPSLQLALSESASKQPSHSQLTHQSLHVFKKLKPVSSVEAVTPPLVFVPSTIEQVSESPPVCSTSGKRRRKNKKAQKINVLYQSPPTIVAVPQTQLPTFSVTTQQSGHSVSMQGFVA